MAASLSWISSADAKATTLLSIVAVVLGLLTLDGPTFEVGSAGWFVFLLLVLSLLASVSCAVGVIWPRTNRREILSVPSVPVKGSDIAADKEPGCSGDVDTVARVAILTVSPTLFAEVPSSYEAYLDQTWPEDWASRNTKEQAFVVSVIAKKKMLLVAWSIRFFAVALVIAGGLVLGLRTDGVAVVGDADATESASSLEAPDEQEAAFPPPADGQTPRSPKGARDDGEGFQPPGAGTVKGGDGRDPAVPAVSPPEEEAEDGHAR